MKKRESELFGEKIQVYFCDRCKNELIPVKEVIKVQEKVMPRIETTRKLVGFGNSIAITLPKELKNLFKKGEFVKVTFDPKEMELTVRKK